MKLEIVVILIDRVLFFKFHETVPIIWERFHEI